MNRSFLWVRRHVDPIGLDLGTRSIRMLQLARHRGQTTVLAHAQRAIPPGSYSLADYDRIWTEAVAEMLAEGNFAGRDAVVALGWDDLQVRNLRIPVMPEEEVGEVVRFEAAERLGIEVDEAEFRFVIAGDVRQGTDIRQEVIIFGTRRSAIEAQLAMLAKMGLRPVAMDAGPCAIFRSFDRFLRRDEDSKQVNAFVDLGYSAARVVVSRGPDLIFFKSIPIGGQRFDELVSEQLDLGISEAAQIRLRLYRQQVAAMTGQKQRTGDDEPVSEHIRQAVIDTLRPALEQLSKEIALCLRYCSVTFRGLQSDTITIVGGEACNTDILRVLSDQVNVPFHVGRPMRNIPAERGFNLADRRTGQPEWAVALGLALKPIPEAVGAAS